MRRTSSVLWTTTLLTLCLAGAAGAGSLAINVDAAAISWDAAPGYRLTLSLSGPNGLYHQATFEPGDAPQLSVFTESGDYLADGVYAWELTASPAKPAKRGGGPEAWSAVEGFVQSGSFTVAGGAFLDPEVPEVGAEKDQVIADDLIVQGSACVGQDCVNGESFGFDTIRLKENNLRIKFQDTSASASFPSNDWQITANDSSNGGLNKFSIDDIDGGRTPFTIEAGAPSHSLYVDDGGRIGMGTSTPVVQLHVKDGNTPTLRLEQDGSSGFTPQTWDVAGNETNFFVRDATNGSTLPLRIFPGAPSNSIFVAATTGDVGLGTTAPSTDIHIKNTGTGATGNSEITMEVEGQKWNLRALQANASFAIKNETSGNAPFRILSPAVNQLMDIGTGAGGNEVTITGNLILTGTCTGCDAVFRPGFPLESIEEHAASMWENSYLPAVGPTIEGATSIDVFEKTTAILQELEKAHIYIEQLHQRLAEIESRFDE